jgi:hypothetical protein
MVARVREGYLNKLYIMCEEEISGRVNGEAGAESKAIAQSSGV